MSTKARRLEAISAGVALVCASRTPGVSVPVAASDDGLTEAELLEGVLLVAHLLDQHGATGLPVLRLLGEVTAWIAAGGGHDG